MARLQNCSVGRVTRGKFGGGRGLNLIKMLFTALLSSSPPEMVHSLLMVGVFQ